MKNTIYKIIDVKTGQQVGKDYNHKQRNRARAKADRLDLLYGGYRYSVKVVFGGVTS